MTRRRGLKPLHPDCATDCDLKILSVLERSKQLVLKKKMHHVLFCFIITNAVPETNLQAYTSLSRHIRKDLLTRRSIASDVCDTAVGCQQFCKELRKRSKRIMFERNYSFFQSLCVALTLSDIPKSVFLINLNWGGTSIR